VGDSSGSVLAWGRQGSGVVARLVSVQFQAGCRAGGSGEQDGGVPASLRQAGAPGETDSGAAGVESAVAVEASSVLSVRARSRSASGQFAVARSTAPRHARSPSQRERPTDYRGRPAWS